MMHQNLLRFCACLGLVVASGCSGSRDDGHHTTGDSGTTTGPGGGNTDDGGASNDNCSDAAKLVYVVDEDNILYSFTPTNNAFTTLGTLSCPAKKKATPFSMAVDRSATAWVLYDSGEVFQVSTKDASCQATTHSVGQDGLVNFGMGFASNSSGSTDETLFIAGGAALDTDNQPTTSTFATMTTPGLVPTTVGSVTGWPELTGTGTAELWGFFPSDNGSTPRVAQIDKTSGADIKDYMLSDLQGDPAAWAFAFWGGDYYIFLGYSDGDGGSLPTNVYKVDGTSGALSTVLKDTDKTIVGAGVSTCAPTKIQ